MILIIPLSDFHIFAKLFRASKNRKFDMPNFTTNLNQMDTNLRSCHGPWGQRAKLSPSSAGVNTPRLSINDLLEVVEEGRVLLQSSLSDFRLLKLLCLQNTLWMKLWTSAPFEELVAK